MNDLIKIGFVLLSPAGSPIPSTRIAALNIFPDLSESNFLASIIFEPTVPNERPNVDGLEVRILSEKIDVVCFQKVHGPSVEALAKLLHASGIKTIFSVCDLVEIGMCVATDATVVITEYLKSLYPAELQNKIYVVHDGIEMPELYRRSIREGTGSPSDPLRTVLVTSASLSRLPDYLPRPDWLRLTVVGKYSACHDRYERFREARWNILKEESVSSKLKALKFYTDRRIILKRWCPASVYEAMLTSDIGIIPVDADESEPADATWRIKSENRLTMKMSLGLPVVAYPIPSYEAIIIQGKNGFLAKSKRDWLECLTALRDPVLRKAIGDAARISVIHSYSRQEQARKFIQVIRSVLGPCIVPHKNTAIQA